MSKTTPFNMPISPSVSTKIGSTMTPLQDPLLNYSLSSSLLRPTSSKSMSIRENVHVMVRCRPRSAEEAAQNEEACWVLRPEEGAIDLIGPNRKMFQFDSVLSGINNEEVYSEGVHNLVRSTMAGYSGTVFAYGQTASGKTYTMMGNKAQPGVIPRAVSDVFNYIREDHHGREYLLRVSYLEIYNERIRDLLGEDPNANQPEIHEDSKRGVYVKGLNETIVTTPEQVMQIIKKGEGSRKVSATEYNKRSSRSHTMFQLVIESKSKDAYPVDRAAVQVSQLNLIDLAGSEKVTKDFERQKEGGYINKSLLTLGTVISKLTSGQTTTHIPFRDSKLTRILQTALSGNARISIICTVNPTRSSKEESLSTLRFAERAKLVKTAAKMTKITEHSELQNCLKKIEELQTKMQEKTEQEAETRGRLKHLLGLILTGPTTSRSSKVPQKQLPCPSSATATTVAAEIPMDAKELTINYLLERSTMQDVVARLEEGLSIQIDMHDEQMKQMDKKLLGYKNSLVNSQEIQRQQAEEIEQCHAKLEESEQRIYDLQIALRSLRQQQENSAKLTIKNARNDEIPQSPIQKLEQELKTLMLKKDACNCGDCRANENDNDVGSADLNQLNVGTLDKDETASESLDIENLLLLKDTKIKDLSAAVAQSQKEAKDTATLQQKLIDEKDQTISDLNLALTEAQQEAENVFITIDSVEDSFCIEAKRAQLEKDVLLLEERCQNQQEQVDIRNSQMLRLEEELAEARAVCVEQQAELEFRQERLVELEAQVAHAQAQVELAAAEAQLMEYTRNEQMMSLIESSEKANLMIEKLRADAQSKSNYIKKLDDTLSRAKSRLAEYETEIIALNRRCSHFESDMEDARKMATLSQEEIRARIDQVSVLETDLAKARELCVRQEKDTIDKNNELLFTIEASLATVRDIEHQVESKDRTIEALGLCIREQAETLEYISKTRLETNTPDPTPSLDLSEKHFEAMTYDQFSQLCDRIQADPDSLEGKLALQWLQATSHNINDVQTDDEENDTRSMHPSLSVRSHPPPYSHANDLHEFPATNTPDEECVPYSQSIDTSPNHYIILLMAIVILYSFL